VLLLLLLLLQQTPGARSGRVAARDGQQQEEECRGSRRRQGASVPGQQRASLACFVGMLIEGVNQPIEIEWRKQARPLLIEIEDIEMVHA
jgi:hypothetical protein